MAGKDDLNLNKNGNSDEAAPGGKRKWVILVLVLLLVAGGGAAAWFFLDADGATTEEGAAAAVEEEPEPIYLGMERFTVNFDYQGRIRYVQADMQLMAHSQDIIDKAQKNMPAVRNRLIMLLSDQDFEALRQVEGKEALRADVRDAVNETLKASGDDTIKDVFFTSFVLQ
ncbi:MAG: flagellar basal body-associated FliL family protein [Chromatocurvus sp.]